MSKVMILIGSDSDSPYMLPAIDVLNALAIPHRVHVASAHRTPDRVRSLVEIARSAGCKVIIAAAGMSAALPGDVAALTTLPVLGVPVPAQGTKSPLNDLAALLSITQMPPGTPVGALGLDSGAVNAALLAAAIIGTYDNDVENRLSHYRKKKSDSVDITPTFRQKS